jgi:hypothetical protein
MSGSRSRKIRHNVIARVRRSGTWPRCMGVRLGRSHRHYRRWSGTITHGVQASRSCRGTHPARLRAIARGVDHAGGCQAAPSRRAERGRGTRSGSGSNPPTCKYPGERRLPDRQRLLSSLERHIMRLIQVLGPILLLTAACGDRASLREASSVPGANLLLLRRPRHRLAHPHRPFGQLRS